MKDYIRFQDPENKVPPINESRNFVVAVIIDNENHDDRMVRLIKNSNDIERDYNWHGEEIASTHHPDNWGCHRHLHHPAGRCGRLLPVLLRRGLQ